MSSSIRRTVAALSVAFLSACALIPGLASDRQAISAHGSVLTVRVENRNFSDATVHAFDRGHRVRVGRVTGKTVETFTFEWFQQEITMLIDFTGGGATVSERMAVYPGVHERLRLTIDAKADRVAALRRG